eukprot:7131527-Pyramimonas_sp.AAC.1
MKYGSSFSSHMYRKNKQTGSIDVLFCSVTSWSQLALDVLQNVRPVSGVFFAHWASLEVLRGARG